MVSQLQESYGVFSVVTLKMSVMGTYAFILIFLTLHLRLQESCASTSGSEASFASEFEPPASAAAEAQMDAIAQVGVAVANHGGGKKENIKQILCQSEVIAIT